MNSVRTIWLIAVRELKQRGKSKAYLLSAGVTTLLLLSFILLPAIISSFSDGTTQYRLGVVGDNEALVATAELLGNARTDEGESVEIRTTSYPDLAAAEAALENNDVELVAVESRELIARSSNIFGNSNLEALMQQAAGSERLRRLTAENADAAAIVEILASEPLEVRTLTGEGTDDPSRAVVAYGGLLLMYVAIITYGAWTLTGVTEEKTNRVVELLLAAVRPWHLLAGKIVGIGLLGLAQLAVTIIAALIAIRSTDTIDLPELPVESVATVLLWFVLGFALYSVAFGMAGALVSRMEDAQTAAAPMSLVSVVGFIVSFSVLEDPAGTPAQVFTFLPPTAPYVVPIRTAFDAIPLWQTLVSIALMLLAIYGMVRLAGRIYAGAILRFGSKVKLREAWRSAEL